MSARHARLAWRCRRGMRELDLLLTRFLEERFDAIPEPDKAAFERLLEHPDQDLLAWIIGGTPAPDPALERVVRTIRGVSR